MKLLIPLLLVSTSALAVTTVQFAQRASTERKRADEAQVTVQKHEARIRELQQAQNNLDRELTQARRPPAPAVESSVVAPPPAAAPAPKMLALQRGVGMPRMGMMALGSAVSGGGFVARGMGPPPWNTQQLSPAAQRAMQWRINASLRRQYDDIGPAMGLSQEQANKFVDLLADQQTRSFEDARTFSTSGKDPAQSMQDMKKRNDAEIAALIGQDKMSVWDAYQKSMPERVQVNSLREQMQMLGAPITDDQRARLLDIITEERQLNPWPTLTAGLPPEEMAAQSIKWQDESERALLERAKSVLTPEQYERYHDYQQWQSEMRADSLRNFHAGSGVVGLSSPAVLMSVPDPARKQ